MRLLPTKKILFFMTLLLVLLAPAQDALAKSAIACHCFKDRAYNPAEPFATDDYILVTSFNSFLARAFDIPKARIVMLKMKHEVGEDDLLIGLKIAQVAGADPMQLFALRREKHSWPKIITNLARSETIQNNDLFATIRSGVPADEIGPEIADALIADSYKVPAEVIGKFRLSGLNEKEISLLFVLAHTADKKPEALAERHSKEGKSWSGIAADLGIEPVVAGKLILHYPARELHE